MPFHVNGSFKAIYSPRVNIDKKAMDALSGQRREHHDEILFGSKPFGLPIDPHMAPRSAGVESQHKRLHDFVPTRFRYLVTRQFLDKVEELEPGVHQFFPVEVRMKSGELAGRDYWFLNICHRTDAIDADKSILKRRHQAYFTIGLGLDVVPKLVFRKSGVDGKCMWIDRRFTKGFFFSDELMEFVEQSKMKELDKWEVFAE